MNAEAVRIPQRLAIKSDKCLKGFSVLFDREERWLHQSKESVKNPGKFRDFTIFQISADTRVICNLFTSLHSTP